MSDRPKPAALGMLALLRAHPNGLCTKQINRIGGWMEVSGRIGELESFGCVIDHDPHCRDGRHRHRHSSRFAVYRLVSIPPAIAVLLDVDELVEAVL